MNPLTLLKDLEQKKEKFSKYKYGKVRDALEYELCKTNLSYLVTEVLDPEYYKPLLAPFHYGLMNFVQREGGRKLILISRGHLKSSLVTIPLPIMTLLQNPDARILITNATLDNAIDFLRSVKGYMEGCEKLKYLFGNFKSEKWTESEIIIKQRTKKQIKEPSILTSSVEKSIVSKHFDLIIADDLVNRESINTREQLLKTKLYYKDLLDLLDPGGTIIVIGTVWHFDDLYADIQENYKFDIFFKTCWDKNKQPIFPKKFSREYLEKLREEKGIFEFSSQYLNSAIDDENAVFQLSWLKYFTELPKGVYNYYLTLDTHGGGESKYADSNGWVLNAVDRDDNWFLLDAVKDKANTTEIIDRLFSYHSRYPALKIGIEKTMFVNALKPELEREIRKRGKYLNIEELKHTTTSKEARIKSLVPRFERGKIFLQKEQVELVEEITRFPKARHDDILDSLAFGEEIAEKPYGGGIDQNFKTFNLDYS
jgi:predicted phage terminase large subunit-like protein